MRTLSIDIETYSPVDLTKSGVCPYAEHPDFEILLFSYAFDDNPVTCIDLAQYENIPVEIINALTDNSVLKTAHNAQFERVCLSKYLFIELPVEQWECTMIKSAMLGLPMSLDAVSKVLNIEQGKMSVGKTLIRYFSIPCKPTKLNGERTRNLPRHDLDKWKLYKEYNIRDVEVERNIRKKIEFFQMPEQEKKLYCLDQKINDIGVMLDLDFVDNAISIHNAHQNKLVDRATQLTSLDNPNSVAQLKKWLEEKTGENIESLSKTSIPEIIENTNDDAVKDILQIRQELSKTSVKKYQSMRECARADNRVGGLLQFYGANRTGRWAGRLIQVQNLPQNHLPDLDLARSLVKDKDLESLEMLFGNVPDTLSQLIRTAFVAKEGHTFMVADFSAIEARVIAWLAGEKWRLDVFATHGKIYEASASAMFNVPIEDVKKGSPLRQKGKIAELALGYQGGVGALQQMGALKMGLKEEELQPLVDAWRIANPHIVKLWGEVNRAALKAIKDKTVETISKGIKIHCSNNCMFITLPSGRKLSYVQPKISTNKFGGTSIQYMGMNQTTKQWGLQDTYGGKLVENCLAGDTVVVTFTGLKTISEIGKDDLLWDGLKWVSHDGVIEKGVQRTISINGIRLTPEHLILTENGWKEASQIKKSDRYESKLPDRNQLRRIKWEKIDLESKMRLRDREALSSNGISQRKNKVLRVFKKLLNCGKTKNPWIIKTSDVCRLEVDERQMPFTNSSSLAQLWRQGDIGLRTLAGMFRKLLRGYGADIPERVISGQNKQRWYLRTKKLPLDNLQKTGKKQAKQHSCFNISRSINCSGNIGEDRDKQINSALSIEPRSRRRRYSEKAGYTEPVYDILNAGDLNRFTVLGEKYPMIVHNCVQAIARDCLAEAMLRLDGAGYDIVMHVHDEVIIEIEKDKADLKTATDIMGEPIAWAKGLLLRADGYITEYYKKD